MAGDWIKMRTDLYRDPKVCVMADLLLDKDSQLSLYVNQNMQRDMAVTRNVMRNVIVGALVSVWGVLRHRGKRVGDDLLIKNCTAHVIDDLSEIAGFGEAMLAVGWVKENNDDPNSIVFPSFFEEFNVDPTQEIKAKNAERQRRFREKQKENSNVTVTPNSNAREEKRREDNKGGKFIPPTVQEVSEYCKERKNGIDPQSFIDHYESNGWYRGKTKIKDWKACVRTWEKNSDSKTSEVHYL